MINLILFAEEKNNSIWGMFVFGVIITAIVLTVIFVQDRSKRRLREHEEEHGIKIRDKHSSEYVKKKYLTVTERLFYHKLLDATRTMNVHVFPQINLASVITKTNTKYRTELFRNADFGIFDENYNVLALIELNDQSHNRSERRERDSSVRQICNLAEIPLITFWTTYENTTEYIRERINEYLNNEKAA